MDKGEQLNNNRVSVIIPAYNAMKWIERAAMSAVVQECVGEVIVVDDKSIDKTYDVCIGLTFVNPKIKIIRNEESTKGSAVSRNIGIRAAKFSYIAFLDADDVFKPNRFTETLKILNGESTIDGVYESIKIQYVNADSELEYEKWRGKRETIGVSKQVNSSELFESLLNGKYGWIHLNGLTLRKEAIKKVGFFDEQLLLTQDTDFILRCAMSLNLVSCLSLPEDIATRFIHGRNVIFDTERVALYRKILWKKWFMSISHNNWEKRVNFLIIKNYIISFRFIPKRAKATKVAFFIIDTVFLLLKHPSLIRKII